MASSNYADRLASAIEVKRSSVVVGLDPHLPLLPPEYQREIHSNDRKAIASAVRAFCLSVIDAVHDIVPAIKPQVAFFEQLGPPGLEALEAVVAAGRKKDLIVISDGKRGDIGSTASAYADYHIGVTGGAMTSAVTGLQADAMTVNAYCGRDSLEPFLKYVPYGKGIYVLVKTSNPGSHDFQDRILLDPPDTKNFEAVAEAVDQVGGAHVGKCGYSSVGIVVGAQYPDEAISLRRKFPRLWFLVPGYGAQGATAADVAGCFDERGLGAIVNASRSILFAYKDLRYSQVHEADWKTASRQAAGDMTREIAAAIGRKSGQRLP